jgi:hypothetical protein
LTLISIGELSQNICYRTEAVTMGQMTMNIYHKSLKSRYLKSKKKDKGKILDEFCATSQYDRKSAIRLFRRGMMGSRDKPAGRKQKYEPLLLTPFLKAIWLATDQMYGSRLYSALPKGLPFYESKIPCPVI